jgi:hypothetical protein
MKLRAATQGGLALVLFSCGDPQTLTPMIGPGPGDAGMLDAATPTPSGLPCNVDKILEAKCRNCHGSSPSFGAPMPMVTRADLLAARAGGTALDLAIARVKSDAKPMPPPPGARLTADEIAVLERWKSAGAPASTEACTPPPVVDGGLDPKCTTDQFVKPSSPFTTSQGAVDQYVCYGFEITVAQKRHITAIAPKVDNAKIVHHVLLLEMPSAQSPTPFTCSSGLGVGGRLVYAWAPGGGALELPVEAGLPLEGTKHYMVQLHYNNAAGTAGETDASGFDLCTTNNLRANDADIVAFGTTSINIPPNPPAGKFTRTCSLTLPNNLQNLHFFGAMPHMHQLGLSMSTKLVRGVSETDLGSVANWDFNTQFWYPLTAKSEPNDKVITTCTWKNDTGSVVRYGEKTKDEMCYSFTMYYPRVPGLVSWEIPARASICN